MEAHKALDQMMLQGKPAAKNDAKPAVVEVNKVKKGAIRVDSSE